ncbi:LON peptidase substrate-binding domain-containing protein [Aquihabitans daechungensis]|uniref:LON peptidase substrate-binding domain-containing protein n=1 Tax=Aquihabitans daechungensis TaxID=1052257 RepID=UPI003BA31F85
MPVRPMFPLGSVLLPGMVLPLHVFEDRYRALVRDCLAADRRFGVTLIERGSEVGGGDIRAMAGTLAEIVQADEQPDGRWGIVAVGSHRIRIREWLPDDPYPRAEVEDWPDAGSVSPSELAEPYAERVATLRRVLAMAVELGAEADPMVELSDDPAIGSYQIGVLSPIGALDRQRLLTAPGPRERLDLLEELLDDQELMIRARLDDA